MFCISSLSAQQGGVLGSSHCCAARSGVLVLVLVLVLVHVPLRPASVT